MSLLKKNIHCIYRFYCAMLIVSILEARSQDKTITLPEFNVNDARQDKNWVKKINLYDSVNKKKPVNSVAELLSCSNVIYIKNYGPGGIATSSARGASSQQSNIIWNGFSINSPSLAMCDLSLLPVNFFDEINLLRGAASILYGSGTAGAVIELATKPTFKKQQEITLSTQYNSLKNSTFTFSHLIEHSGFSSKTDIQLNKSLNEFQFISENEKKTQKNNDQKIAGIKQDFFFKHKKNLFQISAWIQTGNRQIPSLLTQNYSSAYQEDISKRFYLAWNRKLKEVDFSISAFTQHENLNYFSELNSEASKNSTFNSSIELQASKKIKKHNFSFLSGNTTAFFKITSENKYRSRTQIYNCLKYKIQVKKLAFVAAVRNDYYNTKQSAGTYNFTFTYTVLPSIEIYLQNNNLFRAPGLNDLYWSPGGNPKLKSETGFNSEAGIALNKKLRLCNLQFDGLVYYRTMKNLIVWLPTSTGIWQPNNIHSSKHYGSETKSNFQFTLRPNSFAGFRLITNYTVAQRTNKLNEFDKGVNQQLMYCPMYSGSAGLYFSINSFTAILNQSYTGYRYTSEDRSNYLLPYQLTSVQLNYALLKKNIQSKLFFSVENIFNTYYQTISQFAMPGRYFSVGTEIKFKK